MRNRTGRPTKNVVDIRPTYRIHLVAFEARQLDAFLKVLQGRHGLRPIATYSPYRMSVEARIYHHELRREIEKLPYDVIVSYEEV
jgi:hypothetical protein